MSSPRLRDQIFQIAYGPTDNRLNDFYIPALSCSVRYDRMTGFFSSKALAIAAAGVVRLIENGGTMRLLVGAALSEKDVRAIEQGHSLDEVVSERLLAALCEPESEVMRRRVEILGWMVANGTLHIRVVLPKGPDGRPLPAPQSQDYFHPKQGLFTDACGDQVAFSGSINESEAGWEHNYEQFFVFRSWEEGGRLYVAETAKRFERLWGDQEPDWIALEVPDAVRQRLIQFQPYTVPRRDPIEAEEPEQEEKAVVETREAIATGTPSHRERVVFQFLRDAPRLLATSGLGAATGAVRPWPHQARVAEDIVARFPERFLLCDEVGLGKTIEAGLALRELHLSGAVYRCLILAPKSVCRQWQEELYEKFALNVPVFDGHMYHDVFENERMPDTPNPWNSSEMLIASSQLAKRRERQDELLSAKPWDLVLVDEAHHARRKDFLVDRYRPNRLLELLCGRSGESGLKDCTQAMLLMTATPMQVHPVEVWDLLHVLGLGGRWGAGEHDFLRYFGEMRRPLDDVDWDFVFDMLQDFVAMGGEIDPEFARKAQSKLGLVDWQQLHMLVSASWRDPHVGNLSPQARSVAADMARCHTPLRKFMFRNTRRLLREYVRRGVLRANVPHRDPTPVWITMRDEEQDLYGRIEEYITQFYRRYEGERKGLGFVMTVYRRRLTSSLFAVRRSLERRLQFLRGQPERDTLAGLDNDDTEQEDLVADVTEDLDDIDRSRFRDEIEYVEDFVAELRSLGGNDSKIEQLVTDLNEIFRQRNKTLVFTQYTDTMDYLRDQLQHVYGSQVACYSGRGGEIWNGIAWVSETKEKIKNAFLEGEDIKVLLCTEAASEGLNLQTCGVLINYDMPWNPMRVEQRIGRIDRIGQKYDRVWIRHYFYEDTVEARVYKALENRINWFKDVVGELQPILAQVSKTIETVAMTPEADRERVLAQELDQLREELERNQAQGLVLDRYVATEDPGAEPATPVTLDDLERILTSSSSLSLHFGPHPELRRPYHLHTGNRPLSVTFDPTLFDAHPNTLCFVTYGSDTLATLFEAVPEPEIQTQGRVLRCCATSGHQTFCAYFVLRDGGLPQEIERLTDLETFLIEPSGESWTVEAVEVARAEFRRKCEALLDQRADVGRNRAHAEILALEEQGRQVLLQAALVELAMGQQQEFFEKEALPAAFNESAVIGLKRHRHPFAPLLKLVESDSLRPSPTDPFYVSIQGKSREVLRARFVALRDKAAHLVELLVAGLNQDPGIEKAVVEVRSSLY